MDVENFLTKHLIQIYSKHGVIAERINRIFITLNVDKNLAIDAFFEIYAQPEYFDRSMEYKSTCMPSYAKLKQSIPYLPDHHLDRLAFAFILYDLTYNRLHCPISDLYNYRLAKQDAILALDNVAIINFDLGIVIEYLRHPYISESEEQARSSIHALGGISRSKKYEVMKIKIYRDWELNPSSSYALFAREHANKYQLSTKTIESWLSQKFSKPKQ